MQINFIAETIMPIALGIIMLGLGLTLTFADFSRVLLYPKPVLIGLFIQIILLPIVCWCLILTFGSEPQLAVGMMLLAASPGGAMSNLFSHLAKGDVALNITLTAINSLVSIVSLPIIVNFSFAYFLGSQREIPLPWTKVIQVFLLVLGPVLIGLFLNVLTPRFTENLKRFVKPTSLIFLVLVIGAAILKEHEKIPDYFRQVGLVALLFNLVSMIIGYWVPLLLKINKSQSTALAMEIGIHNSTMAIAMASSPIFLNNFVMAIPAAIYALIMFFTASLLATFLNRVNS